MVQMLIKTLNVTAPNCLTSFSSELLQAWSSCLYPSGLTPLPPHSPLLPPLSPPCLPSPPFPLTPLPLPLTPLPPSLPSHSLPSFLLSLLTPLLTSQFPPCSPSSLFISLPLHPLPAHLALLAHLFLPVYFSSPAGSLPTWKVGEGGMWAWSYHP